MTNARRDAENGQMDGQKSLNPVGLESGLTGGGMDWLSIDDPYKDPKEAFSETMWTNLDRFWRFGVQSRISPFTCVASMFHRYSESDFGGYLLDTGEFEYIRYATILEKPEDLVYFHEATGQQFVDPLGRGVGEYISERRGESYYAKNRKDAKVWNSMFIGVPRTDETDFFHAQKIEIITDVDQALVEWNLCISKGRGWDNAATEGAGDYSASALAGIQADGTLVFGDATMEQLDTGSRVTQQQTLAAEDGIDVAICIPEDKAASGKDVVFFTTQALRGYTIIPRAVSNSTIGSTAKARRAYNLSTMVNTGRVKFLHLKRETQPASYVPGGWVKSMQRAMQGFMQGGNDDIIDAAADVTNHLIEDFYKGLVVKNLSPQRNLVTWDTFGKYYGPKGDDQQPLSEIPKHWTIYVGVKITPEASKANSAIIVARAAQNAKLPDTLFIVAEYKKFDANYEAVFDWIDAALEAYCGGNKNAMIWLHADSEQYRQTIAQKLKRSVLVFEGEGGLTELNWYLKPNGKDHPFSEVKQEGANLYGLIADPHQLMAATDEYGLYAVRQEASTWGFTEKGEPSAVGSVLDCLSMICYAFRTSETGLTVDEKVEEAIKVKSPNLQLSVINAMPDQDQRDTATTKRMMEEKRIRQEMNLPVRGAHANRFARR